MTIDSDDMISLPSPPPPRPATRRAAIDAAMRQYDGTEQAPAERATRKRPSRSAWATMHRRPAGALVSAVLIAIVFIPAMPFILRDSTPRVAPQAEVADQVQPNQDAICTGAECADQAASEFSQARPDEADVVAASPSPAQRLSPSAVVANERRESVSAASDRTAFLEAPPPFAAAPAPPPPPPPPPTSEPEAEGGQELVVTGSRIPASTMAKRDQAAESDDAAKPASPSARSNPNREFLSRLQVGLKANDRPAIIGLIGFPLRVKLDGRTQTYRSAQVVERNFDRIFTPQVRTAVLNLRPESLISRDGGRLLGNSRLWFGCSKTSCSPNAPIRIREVHP